MPEVRTVSGTLRGGAVDLTWDGGALAELDQISVYLCEDPNTETTDPGYRIGVVESASVLGTDKAATLTIPADVPSGEYYIRAVYSKADEVNGVVFSADRVQWVNTNTPGAADFTARAAGNLQYELTIPQAANTDGYLVTVYNEDDTVTDFQQVSYERAAAGNTVIRVGGSYQAADPDAPGGIRTYGLTGGRTYTIGVTPYKTVTSGYGESAVYGREVTRTCELPEMVTPTVRFSAGENVQHRTEPAKDGSGGTVTRDVYTHSGLTLTAAASEAVSGSWRLDESETFTDFSLTDSIAIPLTGLAEGEHTITLWGQAADGDSFAASYTFTVDTLPPQLLLSSPVNGSFFGKDGTLTFTGTTDEDARFIISGICDGKTVAELGGTFDKATGQFSFTVAIPDPNSASQHALTISVRDDLGNATEPRTVEVSHGGLADLDHLEVMVNGQSYSTGNIPVPASGLSGAALTLVGVTSGPDAVRFNLTGYNVSWEVLAVEGTASAADGMLTAGAGSQGIVTGKLAVASGAYRTATLCFGAPADHTVAVSATIGGSASGGGQYAPGAAVTLTAVPDAGYRFAGWAITGSGVVVNDLSAATVTFTMPQTGNVTALAAFEPVSQSGGGVSASAGQLVRVPLPAGRTEEGYLPYYFNSEGKKVFVPISAVENGSVRFIAPVSGRYYFGTNPVSFTDIAGRWSEEQILFAARREIFKGIGGGAFAPDGTMDRAMFISVLYRLAGSPAVSGSTGYDDVEDGRWYSDAILWGRLTGIAKGYGGSFGPGDQITREQMCTMLTRWLGYMGYELPTAKEAKRFADAAEISSWAAEAVAFCQTRGLVNGVPGGAFAPQNSTTRGECCAVIERLVRAVLHSAEGK